MTYSPPKDNKFLEGDRNVRRTEGLYWSLDVTNWTTGTVASATISIFQDSNETDVTSDWTTTSTCTVSDQTVTFPKVTVPAAAAIGKYLLTIDFTITSGPFEPGRPWTWVIVNE